MKSFLDNYTDEEFIDIWNRSSSMYDFAINLGYKTYTGDSGARIRKRVEKLKLSDKHFKKSRPKVRTFKDVFCKNSEVVQKVLRDWYKKGEYSEYKCSICGLEPFWNGKELSLTLDHINGDNHDNRLENLRWVCPNCDRQLDTFGSKNRTHLPQKKNYCQECGKEITKESKYCIQCNAKKRSKEKITSRISREDLKNKIRKQSFEEIGREFQVSGNAVKKWCIFYNLPNLKKDINSYSNKEWEKI